MNDRGIIIIGAGMKGMLDFTKDASHFPCLRRSMLAYSLVDSPIPQAMNVLFTANPWSCATNRFSFEQAPIHMPSENSLIGLIRVIALHGWSTPRHFAFQIEETESQFAFPKI